MTTILLLIIVALLCFGVSLLIRLAYTGDDEWTIGENVFSAFGVFAAAIAVVILLYMITDIMSGPSLDDLIQDQKQSACTDER